MNENDRDTQMRMAASEQERPAIVRRRARWQRSQGQLDPHRLVFIDETWAKTNMTRSHGRCPRGKRLAATRPYGHWQTLTFVAALRCDRLAAPCVFDGPINGPRFLAYVEQCLLPHSDGRRYRHLGQSQQPQECRRADRH